MKKILAAMSGGVDSAATAILLKSQGYFAAGGTMCLRCGAEAEIADAQRSCQQLELPFYRFDLQEDLYRFNPTAYHLDFEEMMRLGRAFVELKTESPKIFYIWGHSFEMDYGADHWVRLEEFFKLISNQDDIFYGTNKEVLL